MTRILLALLALPAVAVARTAAATDMPGVPAASTWSLLVAIFLLMLAFAMVMQRKGLDAAPRAG